jgi:hypothetical protein
MRTGWRLAAICACVSIGLLGTAETAAAKTVWLCKPGLRANPCMPSLSTTIVSPSGETIATQRVRRERRPKYDCFYVYPTVSDQPALQANRRIDPELRSIALYQAARYSQDCRVFAPVYRQLTIRGISSPDITPEMRETAYRDVRQAWLTYLRRFNRGRGVVLIGHSQGTFMLRALVKREIDLKPAVRRRLISALLLGGNVTVRAGSDRGGDFRNVGACRSARQTRCVVAFATYHPPVPADAIFGRAPAGRKGLCTNPASLAGGSAKLDPIYPSEPFAPGTTIGALTVALGQPTPDVRTAWLSAPGSYRARCGTQNGVTVLLASPLGGAPVLNPLPEPSWGWHLADANIALGNLTELVRRQARSHLRAR